MFSECTCCAGRWERCGWRGPGRMLAVYLCGDGEEGKAAAGMRMNARFYAQEKIDRLSGRTAVICERN